MKNSGATPQHSIALGVGLQRKIPGPGKAIINKMILIFSRDFSLIRIDKISLINNSLLYDDLFYDYLIPGLKIQ